MKSYYKSNAPEVMAALRQHENEIDMIVILGKEFAEHFGGILLVNNSIHDYRISGLKFDPPKPTRLWTCPDSKSANMQRPRTSITKATAEEKAELTSLKSDWNALFPQMKSDFAPVMKSMGTDWGCCLFGGGGFGMFQHGGYVYVTTGAKLNDCMVEIFTSEYQSAKANHDSDRAAS